MTSIFNSSFGANLQRVLGTGEKSASIKSRSDAGKKEFASVLADLEQHPQAETPKNIEHAVQVPRNKESSEKASTATDQFLTSDDAVFALTRRANELLECTQNQSLVPQKLASSDVKNSTPPLLPFNLTSQTGLQGPTLNVSFGEETEAPEAPVIKSLERVSVRMPSASIKSPVNYKQSEIESIISTAGRYHGIDPTLSKAVAQAESSFRTDAVSKDGHASKGIFQLLDSTAKDLVGRFNFKEQYDPFDPAQNAYLGVGYLRRLHDIFSTETNLGSNLKTVPVNSADDLEKVALAAFNAGEGNVASAQRAVERSGKDPTKFENIAAYLPPSTRAYVDRVTQFREQFARAEGGDKIV